MMDAEVVLNREQRDEILRAVKAIEHQVRQVVGKSDWQALYVIGTNLTIIQANVTNRPRVSSN
jgi:hypothetical protein